jgi:3-deoxy-D-manno-octulosonate 8-phosphate phosphatase KdsC-like HAD superfamily phosphatase
VIGAPNMGIQDAIMYLQQEGHYIKPFNPKEGLFIVNGQILNSNSVIQLAETNLQLAETNL